MTKQNSKKIRHSKLRNTGLLFEMLVRQMATDTLNEKNSIATDILRKYFSRTELSKEFKIYQTLYNTRNLSEAKSNILINSCVEAYNKLNKNKLKKEKYDLISEIKNNYNLEEFFKTKVDNYKVLASIYMIFENNDSDHIDEMKYADYKFTILENLAHQKEDKEDILEEFAKYDRGTRHLIYKTMVNKFNEKYKDFSEEQKKLLKEYINNISTTDKLKRYINEEVENIIKKFPTVLQKTKDEVKRVKLQEVFNFLKPVADNKNVSEKDITNLLYFYELLKEYEKID